jgi:hypothetical protein
VGVFVAVFDGVGVRVSEGVLTGVSVFPGVGVWDAVGVARGRDTVGSGVGVFGAGVAVGASVGVETGVAVGFGEFVAQTNTVG